MRKRGADIELNLGELPAIPAAWKWGRVEDAASDERNAIVDGPFGSNLKLSDYIDPPGVPVLTTGNLRGDYSPGSVRYISQAKFEELRRSEVRGGDILVAKIGSCGLTGVYPKEMPSAIIPANLLKMTVSPDVSCKFVLYYLNSPTFSRFLKTIITATAQPAFNISKFRQLPLPIAPRLAQDTIVAEIEKQFTRLEAGVTALRRVQANLKRYRAAVLKAACEGRLVPTEAALARSARSTKNGASDYQTGEALLARILTERRQNWQGRGQYKEPAAPDTAKLPPLPEGWVQATVGHILRIRNGFAFKSSDYCETGVPLVRQADLVGRWVRLDEAKRLPAGLLTECADFAVRKGDLLIGMSGALGKISEYVDESPALQNQRTGLLRINRAIPTAFAKLVLQYVEPQIVAEGKGIAVQNVSASEIENCIFMLPPLAEQTRIVAEVDRRWSVVEGLESVVTANLQRATRLRQSILQKAFTGELC